MELAIPCPWMWTSWPTPRHEVEDADEVVAKAVEALLLVVSRRWAAIRRRDRCRKAKVVDNEIPEADHHSGNKEL